MGSASPSRGLVLGLRMLLDEASRLGADKVLLQMSGYSRRFAAPNICDLDVIRRLAAVRAGAACDGVSGVAGIDEDHGVDMSVIAFPRIKGVNLSPMEWMLGRDLTLPRRRRRRRHHGWTWVRSR